MADELDALFAKARELTDEDRAAGERAVARVQSARTRFKLRTWASALLASAAMLGGLAYLAQPHDLPTSAAYDAYLQASGDGW